MLLTNHETRALIGEPVDENFKFSIDLYDVTSQWGIAIYLLSRSIIIQDLLSKAPDYLHLCSVVVIVHVLLRLIKVVFLGK